MALLLLPVAVAIGLELVDANGQVHLIGDWAIHLIRTFEAAHGRQLTGEHASLGFRNVHPAQFYYLAVWYELGGREPLWMFVGSAVLNGTLLVYMVRLFDRLEASAAEWLVFSLVLVAHLTAFTMGWWGLSLSEFHNPLAGMIPLSALILLHLAAVRGARGVIPLGLVLHAFAVGCHAQYLLPATAALGFIVFRAGGEIPRRTWAALLLFGVFLWSPVLVDMVLHKGGNPADIFSTFIPPSQGSSDVWAPDRWTTAADRFLEPITSLSSFLLGVRTPDRAWPSLVSSLFLLLVFFAVGVRGSKSPLARAAREVAWVQLSVAFVSLCLLPGEPLRHVLQFLPTTAFAVALAVGFGAVAPWLERLRERGRRPLAVSMLALAAILTALQIAHQAHYRPRSSVRQQERTPRELVTCVVVASAVDEPMLAMLDGDGWRVAAPIGLGLLEAGLRPRVRSAYRERLSFAFGSVEEDEGPWTIPSVIISDRALAHTRVLEPSQRAHVTMDLVLPFGAAWVRRYLEVGSWEQRDGYAVAAQGVARVHAGLFAGLDYDLTLVMRGTGPASIRINGEQLLTADLEPEWQEYELRVPGASIREMSRLELEGLHTEVASMSFRPVFPERCRAASR